MGDPRKAMKALKWKSTTSLEMLIEEMIEFEKNYRAVVEKISRYFSLVIKAWLGQQY